MNLFKRLSDWLGIVPPKQKAEVAAIQDLLELGRQARYAENYQNALEIFENAVTMAQARGDVTALVIARLNIADILIQLGEFSQAEDLLIDLEKDAESRQHNTPLSYTLCAMGYLHQKQEDWILARTYYNRALAIAEQVNAEGAMGRAKGHLADTYLNEGNASYAEHLLREALPLLDRTDDDELASHFIGQYALTMLELGRENDGDRLLDTALQRAKRLNHLGQIRHWQRIIGERKLQIADYSSAYVHLKAFVDLAPIPMPETSTYGMALSNLSEVSRQLGKQQEALDYARQAESILSQLESVNLSSQALLTIGLAMRSNDNYEEAMHYFEQALSSADTDATIMIELAIAQTHAMSGQMAQAETDYLQVIQQLNDESDLLPRACVGLGNVYRQQGKLESALAQWSSALKIHDTKFDYNQSARLICDIAQARYELGDGRRALADYERAMLLLNSVDKETKGLVMANVAIAYADNGDVSTTEAFFTDSIDIAHELGQTQAEALRRNNYARFLMDIGQASRAVLSIEQALKLLDSDKNTLYRAIFVDNLGIAYLALGEPQKAIDNHLLAEEQFNQLGSSLWSQRNHLNIVDAYLEQDNIEDADYYLRELNTEDIDLTIQHHITSANYQLASGNLYQAHSLIKQAVQKAQDTYRQRLLAKSWILKSRIEALQGDKETANTSWQSAEKLLNRLQMPIPNPNWLHVPSPAEDE